MPAGATAAELSEAPQQVRGPPPILTVDAAARVLEALRGDRLRPFYVTMLAFGLRPGETAALVWDDVDLDRATVRVRRNITVVDRAWVIGDSKTHADATLPAPRVAVAALAEQRRAQLAERMAAGPVWDPTADGTAWAWCSAAPTAALSTSSRPTGTSPRSVRSRGSRA